MPVDALYRNDFTLTSCDAVVSSVHEDGTFETDRTCFYATSGGQPGDTGIATRDDGSAIALAVTRHGETKVKQLLEEMDPGFNLLRGCNLDEPLYRDVANFVVLHVVPKEAPISGIISQPDSSKMIQPEPEAEPQLQPDSVTASDD